MAAELAFWKKRRATIKASLTRFRTFILDAQAIDPVLLKLRLEKAKTLLDEFEKIQAQLDMGGEESETETNERDEFERVYFENIAYAERKLESLTKVVKPDQSKLDATATNKFVTDISLPTIKLPTFDGKFEEWYSFKDLFQAVIDRNKELQPVQKLYYLKSCLSGDASQIIQSLDLSADNYEIAWQLLAERFNNKRLIIQNHVRLLCEMQGMTKESVIELRNLIDNALKHIRALKSLQLPIESWDALLLYIITNKLDKMTRRDWERSLNNTNLPKMEELWCFLKKRCHSLDTGNIENNKGKNETVFIKPRHVGVVHQGNKCQLCEGNHGLINCERFLALNVQKRWEAVKGKGLCYNCLRFGHRGIDCRSAACNNCKRLHHTLLHNDFDRENDNRKKTLHAHTAVNSEVLLSTAIVDVFDNRGQPHECRVILDSGSQSNFLTEKFYNKLGLKRDIVNMPISGLGEVNTYLKYAVETKMKSKFESYTWSMKCLIIPQITSQLPSRNIDPSLLMIPENIRLADPAYYKAAEIDGLIGAEYFYELLSYGQKKMENQSLMLQKTRLGWIVAGEIKASKVMMSRFCGISQSSLERRVEDFWTLEELPMAKILSPEEKACEDVFVATTRRDANGRYLIRLPFKENKSQLGNSYDIALTRLQSLERKFAKNPVFKEKYCEFMREYETLGHMREILDIGRVGGYFIPHHGIIKESSQTTKLRVVFDASAKSSTGTSLNDILMVGPVIQDDIWSLLLRFRLHPVVLTADVEKMYRQIRVHPEDYKYQQILWRENTNEEVKKFELQTLTYGTASAPFLATRTLRQLAEDAAINYPCAAKILDRDLYMDDVLTGAENVEEAVVLRRELMEMLSQAGFNLRKWASNEPSVLKEIEDRSDDPFICLDVSQSQKTLGVIWNPQNDTLQYKYNHQEEGRCTKRVILSKVASLFDPLGLLSPVIIRAKIIIQELWKLTLTWDDEVPPEIATSWNKLSSQLVLLNGISFDRFVSLKRRDRVQLHGFGDASEAAYGACIYVRSQRNEDVEVRLLCAKTRVAPMKKKLTLARLELCAAELVSRLMTETRRALDLDIDDIYLWSDSMVTLNWIATPAYKLKTFVSNRVVAIQEATQGCQWRHVPSESNPADAASRGLLPVELKNCSLWQSGPDWLTSGVDKWPGNDITSIEVPELKKIKTLIVSNYVCKKFDLLTRYSSMAKLKRIIAWWLRYMYNLRNASKRRLGALTMVELREAEFKIIWLVQQECFAKEIFAIKNDDNLRKESHLNPLAPFLDDRQLIRVGGRLQHAHLEYEQKHPLILPAKHHITNLIIRETHLKNYHTGTQATLHLVRQRYWPLLGKRITRNVISKCITCFRAKPKSPNYQMGNLPHYRLEVTRPFLNVGVDFCGPFHIKERRHRNRGKVKIYVAVFVCMSSKAIHLETVGDLSTEAFIAALKRLFSRRGKAKRICSDNATNFLGAKNELHELYTLMQSSQHKKLMSNFVESEEILWENIPPRSPHFGGLWEAAVKSFKNHFYKIARDTLFEFETFNTLVIEIEAILNSRPITALSSDPNDFSALTPGHFLIGESLRSITDTDWSKVPENRLSAWQHLQKVKDHFWKRWSIEYLHELNQRTKWQTMSEREVKLDALVLMREDNVPPLYWPMGRVVKAYPGDDGIIRVVDVRTSRGTYKRCVKRLAMLPIE